MGLELSQVYNLLRNRDGTIHFEHLPVPVAEHLGSTLRIVYLSNRSLRHIFENHKDVTEFDILILPMMIRDGFWIGDKPKQACVFYKHPEHEKLYKAAVKVTLDGLEAYVSSFYRCSPKKITSALKRGVVLAGEWNGGRLG
jgi:hypothetical protein